MKSAPPVAVGRVTMQNSTTQTSLSLYVQPNILLPTSSHLCSDGMQFVIHAVVSIMQIDFTFPRQVFTPPSMVSHNTEYKMWDACMDNTSIGVGILSQHGVTSVVEQQYLAAGDNVLDFSRGVAIRGGVGETSNTLTVDASHQWVSVASMLAPSPDRMVGFADLRMCDGDEWKGRMMVCLELFSTATATEKVIGVMERNSLQANNCSFGYVQLNLVSIFSLITQSALYNYT